MQRIPTHELPEWVQISDAGEGSAVSARAILEAVRQALPAAHAQSQQESGGTILLEGGPELMSAFFAEACLDELFLTLAPQVAGRDDATERPGLVAGKRFAPEHPRWGTLVSVKRGAVISCCVTASHDPVSRTSRRSKMTQKAQIPQSQAVSLPELWEWAEYY